MKRILATILLIVVCAVTYAQNFDYTLNQTETSEYVSTTRTMTVFKFSSSTAIPTGKKNEIIKSLALKDEVKSAVFDANSMVLTVEVVKGITVNDLNNVLVEFGVLLITPTTPKEIIDKIQHHSSMN